MKPGRNDPCYCGSGKKYKKCHLRLDEQSGGIEPKAAPPVLPEPESESASGDAEPDWETLSPRDQVKQVAALLRKLAHTGPKKDREEFRRMLAENEAMLSYAESSSEVGEATAALQPHWKEFEKLAEDETAYLARAEALFTEERFAPLRFTATEVRRALEKAGLDLSVGSSDDPGKLFAAIQHLANKDRRRKLALELTLRLPELVAAGRFLDGCMVEHCASRTLEDSQQSNPFLFHLFASGYDALAKERKDRDEDLLRQLGLDPVRLRSMSLDELDSWVQAQAADPAKTARMAELLRENPQFHAESNANLERMERDAIDLLQREDARSLLLPADELAPWLPVLEERFSELGSLMPASGQDPAPEVAREFFTTKFWPALGDMAKSIFTPERTRQLIAQLKNYRSEGFNAGDKGVAALGQAAIGMIQGEPDPAENRFLRVLCFCSLRTLLAATRNTDPEAGARP